MQIQPTEKDEYNFKQKRVETLAKLDNAKLSWFHIKACLVSGIGFFTDAYDLFIINLAMLIMGCVYFKDSPGHEKNRVPVYIDTLIKASGQVGTLFGQIAFGIAADRLGRKKMYGLELMIIVVATCASALSATTVSGLSVFTVLGIWRLILGFGIGGDYPLSAIITSEFATTKHRGAMMAAVFAMQGFGILAASIVSISLLACFKHAVAVNQDNLDYVWRLCIGLGAIPGLISIYFRLTISESPRYTLDVENDIERAAKNIDKVTNGSKHKVEAKSEGVNKASFKDFCKHFSEWKNLKILLGTTVTWFALDVGFYGINLNSGIIIEAIGFSGNIETDPWNCLFKDAIGNLIIALMGLVPGYWFTVFLVDRIGRKTIQIIGFIALTILLLVLGFAYHQIKNYSIALFIVIFTLMQFFQNFGPNATTFIIPGEVFPTRYRSTAHGISAAAGKLGAIVSQVGFFQLKDIGGKNHAIPVILIIFGCFMFIGFLFTLLLPETKGKSLEELAGEEEIEFDELQRHDDQDKEENKIETY